MTRTRLGNSLAVRINRGAEKLKTILNFRYARLCRVRAVAIRTAGVAVLRIPVVGVRRGIGIFDVVRGRRRRVSHSGAEPDRVASAEHDVIRAVAALDGLVVVVAHRIVIGKLFQIRSVSLQHVAEAHRRRAFARGFVVESVQFAVREKSANSSGFGLAERASDDNAVSEGCLQRKE